MSRTEVDSVAAERNGQGISDADGDDGWNEAWRNFE